MPLLDSSQEMSADGEMGNNMQEMQPTRALCTSFYLHKGRGGCSQKSEYSLLFPCPLGTAEGEPSCGSQDEASGDRREAETKQL